MTEEEEFALMLREALTEYDFEAIEIGSDRAVVRLQREVYAADAKGERVEHSFSNPTLIEVLRALAGYLPAV